MEKLEIRDRDEENEIERLHRDKGDYDYARLNVVCLFSSNSCSTNNSPFINSKSGISISVQDVDASGGNIQLDR